MSEPANLTVAYVAIGAAREIDRRGGLNGDQCDAFQGELGFISGIVDEETVAMLDMLATNAGDRLEGVFAYEVAEAYGKALASELLDGRTINRSELATRIVGEACSKDGPKLQIAKFPCYPPYAVLVGEDELADMDTASGSQERTLQLAAERYPGLPVILWDDPGHYSQRRDVASATS